MKIIRICVVFFAIAIGGGSARAQDVHFSQFYETSILRNPALTGIFTEDFKVGVVYRNQWASVSKPYVTSMLSSEFRFGVGQEATNFFTIGLLAYSDKAGAIGMKTTGIYPSVNYNLSLEDKHASYLSMGFTAGSLQRSFDMSKTTWDNQWVAGIVVPSAGPGESLPEVKINHWDLGAGLSFNSGIGEEGQFVYFLGFSGYHFTKPQRSFYANEDVTLPTRWNGSLGINWAVDDAWNVELHANGAKQGRNTEIMGGGLVRWRGMDNRGKRDFALAAGAFYRFNDAIAPIVRVEYKGQALGLSYDINVSTLKAASRARGGLELTAFLSSYYHGNVDDKRLCPRF